MIIEDKEVKDESEVWDNLPSPSNKNLLLLFKDITQVVFKLGGVSNNRAMTNTVVLTITDEKDIAKLVSLLKIDEPNSGFICMCSGTYAIELYTDDGYKDIIGFHHGTSIRYRTWGGDAALMRSDTLLRFLYQLGLKEPLLEKIESTKRTEEEKTKKKEWLRTVPQIFTRYSTEIEDSNTDYFSSFVTDLNSEYRDKNELINVLLRISGEPTGIPWVCQSYEKIITRILSTYELQEVIGAYLVSNKSPAIIAGVTYFVLSCHLTRKKRKHLKLIPDEVFTDMINYFTRLGNRGSTLKKLYRLKDSKDDLLNRELSKNQ